MVSVTIKESKKIIFSGILELILHRNEEGKYALEILYQSEEFTRFLKENYNKKIQFNDIVVDAVTHAQIYKDRICLSPYSGDKSNVFTEFEYLAIPERELLGVFSECIHCFREQYQKVEMKFEAIFQMDFEDKMELEARLFKNGHFEIEIYNINTEFIKRYESYFSSKSGWVVNELNIGNTIGINMFKGCGIGNFYDIPQKIHKLFSQFDGIPSEEEKKYLEEIKKIPQEKLKLLSEFISFLNKK